MVQRYRGKIFVKTSNTAFLTEDENGNPVFEEHVKTFSIVKKNKKFIVYELRRNNKPIRKKTIIARKGIKHFDIIKKIQNNEIRINEKYVTAIGHKGSKLVQTNYKSKIKGYPQMIALVQVIDTGRKLEDVFIGYSSRHIGFLTNKVISKLKKEIILMAIAKFYNNYGHPIKSDDVTGYIIEYRFQYYRLKHERN